MRTNASPLSVATRWLHFSALAILFVVLLAACRTGPEGKYRLDKEATSAALRTRFPKSFDFSVGVDSVKLELLPGGKYQATTSALGMTAQGSKPMESTDIGEWKDDGGSIKLKGSGREVTCRLEASKLDCEGDPLGTAITGGRESPVFFKKE